MMLGVVGSRDFHDLDLVTEYLSDLVDVESVVSGGARGVDRTAEQWAKDNGLAVVSFRPLNLGGVSTPWCIDRREDRAGWRHTSTYLPERYRSFAAAAFVRNGYIVEWADQVVAFWDGKTRGTGYSVNAARAAGKLLDIVR